MAQDGTGHSLDVMLPLLTSLSPPVSKEGAATAAHEAYNHTLTPHPSPYPVYGFWLELLELLDAN